MKCRGCGYHVITVFEEACMGLSQSSGHAGVVCGVRICVGGSCVCVSVWVFGLGCFVVGIRG